MEWHEMGAEHTFLFDECRRKCGGNRKGCILIMANKITDILKHRIMVLDGAMGTMIQRYGLREEVRYRKD